MPKDDQTTFLFEDVSGAGYTAAWLFGFEVDKSMLLTEHEDWLLNNIVKPIMSLSRRLESSSRGIGSRKFFKIWIIGAASRTASWSHNLKLSKERADATESFLKTQIEHSLSAWAISTHYLSEIPAIVRGNKNDIENTFDRAVLVVLRQSETSVVVEEPPPVRLPVKTKPVSCRFSMALGTFAFEGVQKSTGNLFVQYEEAAKQVSDYWMISMSGGSLFDRILPSGKTSSPQSKTGKSSKSKHHTGTLSLRNADIFCGYFNTEFSSKERFFEHLSHFDNKPVQMDVELSRVILIVDPRGHAHKLWFPHSNQTDWSFSFGSIWTTRKRMQESDMPVWPVWDRDGWARFRHGQYY